MNPRYGGSSGRQGLTNSFGFRSLAAWTQPVAALTAGTQGFQANRDEIGYVADQSQLDNMPKSST